MKLAKMLLVGGGVAWMAFATWSVETSRRNAERAAEAAAHACGLVYRDIENRSAVEGYEPPPHPGMKNCYPID